MKREDIIKEWIAGRLSNEELDEKIKGNDELESLKKVISGASDLKVPQKRSKEEAWSQLSSKIEQSKVIRIRPYMIIGIAASLTLIVVVAYYIFTLPESVTAPKGEHISQMLPDGSQVWINADSKISFKEFSQQESRRVTLVGEAYFDVREGGSFEVVGDYGTVVVLGTSFNVSELVIKKISDRIVMLIKNLFEFS